MISGAKTAVKGMAKGMLHTLFKGWRYDYALQRIRFLKQNYWRDELEKQFEEQYDTYRGQGVPAKAKAKRDCWLCWVLLGADPSDYFDFELFRKGWKWRHHHVTLERLTQINQFFNVRENWDLFDNKALFYQHWGAYLNRPWCEPQNVSYEKFEQLFASCERLIVKPAVSYGGKGIYTIDLNCRKIRDVFEQLQQEERPVVAEAFLKQRGLLHDVYPDAVNILRITTLRLPQKIEVVYGFFTTGTGKRVIANDCSGGVSFTIDLSSGRLGRGQGFSSNGHSVHPDTGVQVEGQYVPRWEEVKAYACKAHQLAPEGIRLIGWDICVSDDGMCIIEGNTFPGFPELPDPKDNLWKQMKCHMDQLQK